MDTARIARTLGEMATLLEVQGENAFRVRAYHQAAQALKGLPSDLRPMIADGTLATVPGIGPTLLAKITQLSTTGHLPAFDDLKKATPPGLIALLRVPGLGPKKIKLLHEILKIESLADLRAAGEDHRIAALRGFGEKTEAKILAGIDFLESVGNHILQSTARRLVAPIVEALQRRPEVIRISVCGSLRRRTETVDKLDLLVSSNNLEPILAAFIRLPEVARVLTHGPTEASVCLLDGVSCHLRGVADPQFALALHQQTGSAAYNLGMQEWATQRGLRLSETALEGPEGPIACATEADLFHALGLSEIPPELREGADVIARAAAGESFLLVTRADLTGTFHCHTDWSDGGATLEEMVAAAQAAGLSYLGIADHSRAAAYAGGLSIERVQAQWAAIDALNARLGAEFRILKGTECDILADGSLDFPDEVLADFDYVVASIHSGFGMDRASMTARICRAVRHPQVTMLGHPTGRLLLARDGYAVDLDAVLAAASEAKTMVEINANPHRLDLDSASAREAHNLGILVPINPDAHGVAGFADLDYGVGVARRAGLPPSAILNARPLDEVLACLDVGRR